MAVMNDGTISSWPQWTTSTSVNTSGWTYIPTPLPMPTPEYTLKIYDDICKKNERSKDMMGLYEMAAVNTKTNEFFCDKFVAKTSNSAERKLIKKYPEIDEWDENYLKIFHTISLEWETTKPQEVKIVKE